MPQEPVRFKHPAANPGLAKDSPQLDLKVIFTDRPKTAAALAAARAMARGLSAHITVLAAQVVPYPLPLAAPDVPVEFTERMLQSIAVENTAVEIHLCRDRNETIRRALPPNSLVIVGARKWRWWTSWLPSRDRSLAKALQQDGRRVLVVSV